MSHFSKFFLDMNYILYVSQRNKIVGLNQERKFWFKPASLGQLETRESREGQVRQRHTSYEIVRPMETTARTHGSHLSRVKLTPLM
jgi:hypothetical protein